MASFNGHVVKERVDVGSKSERLAVLLITPGQRLVLKRAQHPAFTDPDLDVLVGKRVDIEGEVWGHTLLMKTWSDATD